MRQFFLNHLSLTNEFEEDKVERVWSTLFLYSTTTYGFSIVPSPSLVTFTPGHSETAGRTPYAL